MATPTARYRGREASNWLITSVAVSFVLHLLVMHYMAGVRILDVAPFTEKISRWFNVVEMPESIAPEIAPLAASLPDQATQPAPPKPEDISLAKPAIGPPRPGIGTDPGIGAPARAPEHTRLPGTELPVIHRKGSPNIDQTLTQMGALAPLRGSSGAPVQGTDQAGTVRVAEGLPTLPAPTAPELGPLAATTERPAAITHAGPLAPPSIKPTATAIHLPAETPAPGLLIPLEDTLAKTDTPVPHVLIGPTGSGDTEDPRPVIPFGNEVGVDIQMYAEPGNPRYYFRFEIRVTDTKRLPPIPKDVMFICDVSLSIRAQELEITRAAIARYLHTLRGVDRFNIVVFSEQARKLFPGFVEPTPERLRAAEQFVRRIPGQIKTDVYRVMRAVVRDVAQQSPANRPCNVYFVSDGSSTAGIRDVRRIVNEIGALVRPNFAIFPFDAGSGGNRYLLDLLAYRSRGTFTHTDQFADAPKLLGQLFGSYDSPVLMDLKPSYAELNVDEVYPAFIPHLYADQPIVIYGRCTPGQNVTIKLQGTNPYARRALKYQTVPGAPDSSRADIAREWARRKIHHLVSHMAQVGEKRELKAEIRRLGEHYRIPTPYRYRR